MTHLGAYAMRSGPSASVAERRPEGSDVGTVFTSMISRIPGVEGIERLASEASSKLE